MIFRVLLITLVFSVNAFAKLAYHTTTPQEKMAPTQPSSQATEDDLSKQLTSHGWQINLALPSMQTTGYLTFQATENIKHSVHVTTSAVTSKVTILVHLESATLLVQTIIAQTVKMKRFWSSIHSS